MQTSTEGFLVEADNKRSMVDVLVQRVFRPDFEKGDILRDPDIDGLKSKYRENAVDRFLTDDEWEDICQHIYAWQDEEESREEPVYLKILKRFKRFPTIEKVRSSFGDEKAEEYRAALERIEDTGLSFPDEKFASPWRKFDLDTAICVVCDVIAPNINDEESMREALNRIMMEIRARRRERSVMDRASLAKRKSVARSIGIWFPINKDILKWRIDPRTKDYMPQVEALMEEVIKRMRLVRSYLQYIPRKRLSTRACADLPMNIERMKAYLKGFGSK